VPVVLGAGRAVEVVSGIVVEVLVEVVARTAAVVVVLVVGSGSVSSGSDEPQAARLTATARAATSTDDLRPMARYRQTASVSLSEMPSTGAVVRSLQPSGS
jgi:hypothetical protein